MKTETRKRYTAEFKAQAVELVGLGKPVPEVAEELQIGGSILYGWVRKDSQSAQFGSEGLRAGGEVRCARILDHEHKEISDNEDRDQKTIHHRIQSPGGRVGGPWQTRA